MRYFSFIIVLLLPKFATAQTITLFAGGGSMLGDGGPAINAHISDAGSGMFDINGNYYVLDLGNRVRKVDTNGIITTVAGTGVAGYSGDNGPATLAKINEPSGLVVDTVGNVYFSESGNCTIRKIDVTTGIITTVAGNGVVTFTCTGDGSPATDVSLADPQGICFDKAGNLYVAEYFGSKVRKISRSGIITTFAGNGTVGYSGDGSRADTSEIGGVGGLFCDTAGNIFLADIGNSRVLRVNTSGILSTLAGTGTGSPYSGDEIPATSSNIVPYELTMDDTGNLYITDIPNYRVRKIDITGTIHTVAGNGILASTGDGGPATAAEFAKPNGVAFDACGNLYVPEANTGHVRKIAFYPSCVIDSAMPALNTQSDQNAPVTIFPNPTYDLLTISNVNLQTQYLLYSLVGTVMQQGTLKTGDNMLSLQSVPSGLYLLELTDDEGRKTVTKIVKE